MSAAHAPDLSVTALFTERDERRRREQEAQKQLQKHHQEELAAFSNRLENFKLTEAITKANLDRIKHAFDRGDSELMFTSFPSDFCSDGGRAIIDAGEPPINKPTPAEATEETEEPEWVSTLPAGLRKVFAYWKDHLKPGGFGFSARIINFPNGMPGDVGLFFTWPKVEPDTPH